MERDDDIRLDALVEMSERYAAAAAVAALHADVWYDTAKGFTCMEADAIATFLGAWRGESLRLDFLSWHAQGDDEGDDHFHLREDQS